MTGRARLCEQVARAVLDDRARLDGPLEEHLAGCERCQGLARAHRAALGLRAPASDPPLAIEPAEVLRRVRRRRRARASALLSLGAVAIAAVAGVALRWPQPPAAPADGFSVAQLAAEVDSYTDRHESSGDPVLSRYSPVLAWLAPPPGVRASAFDDYWLSAIEEGGAP